MKVQVTGEGQLVVKPLEYTNRDFKKAALDNMERFGDAVDTSMQDRDYLKIIDFDDHFEDPGLDWRN